MVTKRRGKDHGEGPAPLVIVSRDQAVREWWAAYIGSTVLPNGEVPGFDYFELGMSSEARIVAWSYAEAFARFAGRAGDASNLLRESIAHAKHEVQFRATHRADGDRPPRPDEVPGLDAYYAACERAWQQGFSPHETADVVAELAKTWPFLAEEVHALREMGNTWKNARDEEFLDSPPTTGHASSRDRNHVGSLLRRWQTVGGKHGGAA